MYGKDAILLWTCAIVCGIVTGGQLWQSYMPFSQVSSLMTDRCCHKGNEIWRFLGWNLASLKNKYFKKYLKIYETNPEV